MCILALAWQVLDDMPLLLLSNRDEFLQRPTQAAHQWSDAPIYAGRDQQSGGTWLGIHQTDTGEQNGRFAAVLNYRDGIQALDAQHSRGELVSGYLQSRVPALTYARHIDLSIYAGFNLLLGDDQHAVIVNNRGLAPRVLEPGLHVLSNGQPDALWFKSRRLKRRINHELLPLIAAHRHNQQHWLASVWHILSDTTPAPSTHLPDTGIDPDIERALSSICIDTPAMPQYGTRTQSLLTRQTRAQASKLTLLAHDYPH